MNWNSYIIKELNKIYGEKRVGKMSMTVIPGIMLDFQKMLMRGEKGKIISEEYLLDDGRAKILIEGKAGSGIERISVQTCC